MVEYLYRKEFGLSYEQLLNEPYEVYLTTLAIIRAKSETEARQQRARERIENVGNK